MNKLIIHNNSQHSTAAVLPVIQRIMGRGFVSELGGKPCYCLTTQCHAEGVTVHFSNRGKSNRADVEDIVCETR